MESEIKLFIKHRPADNPGSWLPSDLKFEIRADRNVIEFLENKIRIALAECSKHPI